MLRLDYFVGLKKGVNTMEAVFSTIAIMVIILIGASMLTLVGVALSLGYYDKQEVRTKAQSDSESDRDTKWYESPTWG